MSQNDTAFQELANLKNIGEKTARWLMDAGIRSKADLARVGSIEACKRMTQAGYKVSIIAAYAIEGALADTHWNSIPQAFKFELGRRFAAMRKELKAEALLKNPPPPKPAPTPPKPAGSAAAPASAPVASAKAPVLPVAKPAPVPAVAKPAPAPAAKPAAKAPPAKPVPAAKKAAPAKKAAAPVKKPAAAKASKSAAKGKTTAPAKKAPAPAKKAVKKGKK